MTDGASPIQRALPISGRTRLYAILGCPVAGVRSPEFFNQWFAEQGRDAVFIALEVSPENLASAWQGLRVMNNLDGVVVTMPHKNAIVTLLDRLTERAERLGAVNTIRRETDGTWCGDMCDGEGFAQVIEQQGATVHGASALLIGAGGAGAAIAWALAQRGLKRLQILESDERRLDALAQMLRQHFPELVVHVGTPQSFKTFDLAINATPLGMREGDPLPFDPRELGLHCHVCDVVGNPVRTALLQAAEAHGLTCHAGDGMHRAQGRIAMEFLGLRPSF